MKIVLIGGSGRIGKQLATLLRQGGQDVTAASPSTGVDTVTGAGLAEALQGAEVVVDVSNAPTLGDEAVLRFFRTSTHNLLAAEAEAGVRHHVALTIVGADRLTGSGYLRAKVAQESLIEAGPVPYTIVRATQFFEFLMAVAQAGTQGGTVRVPSALMQPVAAADVAAFLAEVAVQPACNGRREIGGPQALPIDQLLRRVLRAHGDAREVITDADARYFGARLAQDSLTAGAQARIGTLSLDDWLAAEAVAH
jgi:uncharacterized protein YbjT (DUF2867 family)